MVRPKVSGPITAPAKKPVAASGARFNPIAKLEKESSKTIRPGNVKNSNLDHLSTESNPLASLVPEYDIYVFNLAPEVTENDLWRLFGPFGAIKNVAVVRDQSTKETKGYGFVTMKNLEEATQAIEILNSHQLHGRPLKISFKGERRDEDEDGFGEIGAYQIYVFNVSANTTEDSLWKLFAQFGAVKNVAIMHDPVKNTNKGYAFITMKNLIDAQNAIKTINGFTLDGRTLSVSFKGQRPDEMINPYKILGETSSGLQSVPIYVNNLPNEIEDQTIWKLFSQFGAIKDVNIVRDLSSLRCKGYGFVNMKDLEEATLAINTLNGFNLEGKNLQVNFKSKKNKEE
ncbi:ELAV-like protein 1 [Condylostylus longicornis]|uniref:ELAV-like protein 1 n=1 Tax=Condylostylus longicornis TaxID=2530218 RepID=UPI00244DE484|nr:ELAV-like protein 1 [Condylostylus longicornis]